MSSINFALSTIKTLSSSQITAIISKFAGLMVSGLMIFFGHKNLKSYDGGLRKQLIYSSTVLLTEDVNVF